MSARHILGTVLVIVGIVLTISSLYNGFWVGVYGKATFHGLVGIASVNMGLSLD